MILYIMKYLRVKDKTYIYQTEPGEDSDELYSWRGCTDTSHSIAGIELVSEKVWYDICVDFEIESDKTYHLLYVLYGTGDSFGKSDGNIDFIGLYESIDCAIENKKRIKEHYNKQNDADSSYSVKLITRKGGKEYLISTSWIGYFESLEDIIIQPVELV